MRIAVMAAGAVGGYYGARMAVAGHDVFFVARGAHRDAMRRNGLKIESPHGNLHLPKPNVTDDPGQIGPVDIVLFAVKLWDTEKAAEQSRPLVGADTRVITFQNGVDSVERTSKILGADKVAGGAVYLATVISAPGVISHTSPFARMVCGPAGGKPDAKINAFGEAAKAAGIDIVVTDAIERELWQKFILLAATSGVTAGTRKALGPIMADPDTRAFFRKVMEEVLAVGRASGIPLSGDFIDDRMKFADGAPGMKASMLNDLEAGNRLELDWLAGKVVELGRKLKVPTPANEAVYALLKLHRMGRN